MDVNAYVAAHDPEWRRLDALVKRRRRLTGSEVDELVALYQRTTTHLSTARSAAHDPVLVAALSARVARARAAVTGAHAAEWGIVGRFAFVSFPAMAYRARWWWLGTAAGSLLVAFVIGWWVARSPGVQAALLPRAQVRQLVNHQFQGYYSQYAAPAFAAKVWTNNAWVAAESLIFGILLGLPPLLVLFNNAANMGVAGALMIVHGRGVLFFALILPHGMLELSAVFLAAATGLRLGWTVIDPGPRRRGQALAEEGRQIGHHRARAGRRAAGVRRDRSLRHPVAASDLGADRDRPGRRGCLPRLCHRAGPPGSGGRADRRHGRCARGGTGRRLSWRPLPGRAGVRSPSGLASAPRPSGQRLRAGGALAANGSSHSRPAAFSSR